MKAHHLVISLGSLPDRQLRNAALTWVWSLVSSLPDRQLRNYMKLFHFMDIRSLPDRQLRKDL